MEHMPVDICNIHASRYNIQYTTVDMTVPLLVSHISPRISINRLRDHYGISFHAWVPGVTSLSKCNMGGFKEPNN